MFYKQVTARKPQGLSIVAAVTRYGDAWTLGVSLEFQAPEITTDRRDFVSMSLMERGLIGRIRPQDVEE